MCESVYAFVYASVCIHPQPAVNSKMLGSKKNEKKCPVKRNDGIDNGDKKNCFDLDKSKLVRQWADYVCCVRVCVCVRLYTNGNLMKLARFEIKQSKLPDCEIVVLAVGGRRKTFDSIKLSHHYKDHLVENWIFT